MKAIIIGHIINNKDLVNDYLAAESFLRSHGVDPVNPVCEILDQRSMGSIVSVYINAIDQCDVVFLASNWIECPCARVISMYAAETGKRVIFPSRSSVDISQTMNAIIKSVESSFGFSFDEIIHHGKKRKYYYSRLILVNGFYKRCGMSDDAIHSIIDRDESTVKYCKKKFPYELRYNPEFRKHFEMTESIYNQMYYSNTNPQQYEPTNLQLSR